MNNSIQQTIVELRGYCRTQGRTLGVAESLTGGRIQSLITSVSGASDFFRGGMTAYHIDTKVALLAVDREVAAACNCVSQAVAEQMSAGICRSMSTDFGIATTGYAQPDPSLGITTPFAYVAGYRASANLESGGTVIFSERIEANGDRFQVQTAIAEATICRLRDWLVE
ncbi:MAG: CinA family protein [Planctomycetota bacterium]